jgi:hypothetical protein
MGHRRVFRTLRKGLSRSINLDTDWGGDGCIGKGCLFFLVAYIAVSFFGWLFLMLMTLLNSLMG